ncbi:MAG: C10 family peptidase [Kiritimatiellia bacterium]
MKMPNLLRGCSVFLGIIFFGGGTGSAAPVSEEDVVAAARGWLAVTDANPLQESLGTGLLSLEAATNEQGEALYYAVALEKGGVLVLAADDAIEPVIAFSPRAKDFSDPAACNHLRLMLEGDLASRLEDVKSGAVKAAGAKASKWALLIEAAKNPQSVKGGLGSVSDVRVSPLVSTKWSQSYVYQGSTPLACYNYYTPPYTAGAYQNYYCGCVATALAQLMRYYQHPKSGVGTASFPIQNGGYSSTRSLRGGNGYGGRYDWANMPTDPTALARVGKLSGTQRMAIGALCHDAGVASQMSYASYGSYAYLCWSQHPLKTVFKYASTVSSWTAAGGTILKKDVNTAFNPCLDAGMPCAVAIQSDYSGHAVVVDGYGYAYGSLYHHLNMGWSGSENAWYNLPDVSTSGRHYTRMDGVVFNVHPTLVDISVISGRFVDSAGRPLAGVKVVARDMSGVQPRKSTLTNSRGIYAFTVPGGAYEVFGLLAGYGFKPESKIVTTTSTRNSWANNFKRVTRIMRLSTVKLAFGRVPLFTEKLLSFKVFNDGTAPLTVSNITLPAGFSWTGSPFTIPVGGYQKMQISFSPTVAGIVKGDAVIQSNRSGGSNTFVVTGNGIN